MITDIAIKALKKPGRYHVGPTGLYLVVKATTREPSKRFVFRFTSPKTLKVTEIAIGQYPACSLKTATARAAEKRGLLDKKECPAAAKQHPPMYGITFGQTITHFLEAKKAEWRDANATATVIERQLARHAGKLLNIPVANISAQDLIATLDPAFKKSNTTARRTLKLCQRVLNFALAQEWRTTPTPTWEGQLENRFPKPVKKETPHHASIPFATLPALVTSLVSRGDSSLAAQAILLTMLTAVRTSEATNAQWKEFDLSAALWTIPGSRMKAGKTHVVPLSRQAIALLGNLRQYADPARNPYVFPGRAGRARTAKPISDRTMYMYLIANLRVQDATIHGLRASFRNWAAEAEVDFTLAEMCLAHAPGSQTVTAYYRTSLVEKRRAAMQDWADFLYRAEAAEAGGDNVVPMVRRSA